MKIYVGLAIADSMFPEQCQVERRPCPPPLLLKLLSPPEEGDDSILVNCCNPSHVSTLQALKARYDVDLIATIPPTPPRVSAQIGDLVLVLSVRGLPRLTDRHEYTEAEVSSATFSFGMWNVLG